MHRQRIDLVIEWDWDSIEDPDFSIHKALVSGIYAAHDPLTGFLGKVWDWCKRAAKKVTNWVGRVWQRYSPAILGIAAGVVTLLSGGTLGAAAFAAVSTGISSWAGSAGYDVGGVIDLVGEYADAIGAVLPESWKETLEELTLPVKGMVEAWSREQWARIKTKVMEYAEHVKPMLERADEILKPWKDAIEKTWTVAGMASPYAEKVLSGQTLGNILSLPPEFGLMRDVSLEDYIAELKSLVAITPPVPPVSMPACHIEHLSPPVHQLWETVTGIPKIIPALEGVWNAIKDTWAIIKDTFIMIANWLRYTFQETLNLIITGIGDISRFVGSELAELTARIWESVGDLTREIRATVANFGQTVSGWINYLIDLFRTQLGWIREVIAGIPVFLGEVLQQLGASLYQGISYFAGMLYEGLGGLGPAIWSSGSSIAQTITSVFTEYMPAFFRWLWEEIKAVGRWVSESVVPQIISGAKGAWAQVEEYFKRYTYMAWSAAESHLKRFVPMTPEKAPSAAMGLLGIAVAFGMGAHTLSTVAEIAHPLKEMGVHTLSAFMADMGNFGTIAASTMGVLVAYSLRRPMGYYVNSLFRPTQPREGDLMMMAVKPDISIETFRRGMAYQGLPEDWINAYQRTMYREPRYFELSMMGEDETATVDWLFTKARRAGYTHEDSLIFVRSLLKKVSRTQLIDAYRQAFYSYKEGYITREQFTAYLDGMEIRVEAKQFATLAADLAYRNEYIGDMVTILTNTYLAGLMSEDDFTISVHSLGIEERRARLIIEKARIRMIPKVMREVKKEAESAVREEQKKLQDLYRELYRAGKITEVEYTGLLVAMGMTGPMAGLTVELEAVRMERIEVQQAEREAEKLKAQVVAEQVRRYKDLYEKDQITFEHLVGFLVLAGKDPELALAIAETERARKIPKPKAEA